MRLLALSLLIASGWLSSALRSDEPGRVGLVIRFEDGRVETFCLEVEGEVTGADLLLRSGLDVVMDTASSMGVTICRIEGQGCDFPAEHCFCRCMGGSDCAYWNYFYREPGGDTWTYSNLGAGVHKAEVGSVEAWVWGDGHTPPSDDLTFEAVCAAPTHTPTPSPTATTFPTSAPTATSPRPTTTLPLPTPNLPTTNLPTTNLPTTNLPTTNLPTTNPSPADYWPFALALLALIAAALVIRRRT